MRTVLGFEELDEQGKPAGRLHLAGPPGETALHESAHGTVVWLFDDNDEDASDIKTGERD